LDTVTELSIKMACRDLVTRYAMAFNRGDLDAFVALFSEDAVWHRPVGTLHGPAEIRAFMESLPQEQVARHVNGASWAEPIDEDHARGWSQTVVYQTAGTRETPARLELPTMIAEYVDEYVRHGDDWRFSRRDTSWVFLSDPVGGSAPGDPRPATYGRGRTSSSGN
jgi:uncharacterized protein (TIGR02246 family)